MTTINAFGSDDLLVLGAISTRKTDSAIDDWMKAGLDDAPKPDLEVVSRFIDRRMSHRSSAMETGFTIALAAIAGALAVFAIPGAVALVAWAPFALILVTFYQLASTSVLLFKQRRDNERMVSLDRARARPDLAPVATPAAKKHCWQRTH